MALELLLFVLSIIMFGAQFFAWRWSVGVERRLEGRFGYELAALLSWILGWSLLARLFATIATALLGMDVNMDATILLAFVSQVFGAVIFGGAAYKIWRISKDDANLDPPAVEGTERLEGVGVQVDDVSGHSAVAVDDLHADAALSGTH